MKIFQSLFLVAALVITGCAPSSTISLSQSPSYEVLGTVEPVNNEVQYHIRTKVQDPYTYKNNAGYEFVIPINTPYNSNIRSFLNTKFSKIGTQNSKADKKIVFELSSFSVDYKNKQNTADFLSGSGDANVNAQITSNVAVFKNNQMIGEKSVTTTSNYNERLGGKTQVQNVYEQAANDVINKHIIMIDNFITSTIE